MKKVLFFAVMLLLTTFAFAQKETGKFSIQPKVGLNVAHVTDWSGSGPRYGLVFGVEGEYQASSILGLSAGLIYSAQGGTNEDVIDGIRVDETLQADYLNIPIMANIYVVKGLALKFGVQPGFNVKDKVKGEAKAEGIHASVSNDADLKSFDFSIPVGLSYEFKNIVLDARYNFGLTKIADGDGSKNSVLQVTLGYKF